MPCICLVWTHIDPLRRLRNPSISWVIYCEIVVSFGGIASFAGAMAFSGDWRLHFSVIFALFALTAKGHNPCTNHVYGTSPCTFLPAAPGKLPTCAQPGLTYCEHPDHYPGERIQSLIQKWRFDHTSLIVDESREDFTADSYPPPTYAYTKQKDSYFPAPEPIYIPKPAQTFDYSPPSNYYIPPKLNHTTFPGYPDRQPVIQSQQNGARLNTYKYLSNIPAQGNIFGPTQSVYSGFALPHAHPYDNRIWDRKLDKEAVLARKRRAFLVSTNYRKLKSLGGGAANGTRSERRKRQSALVGEALCRTRSNYIMPRAAVNSKGNWMYIVNMPQMGNRYSQLVKSETCVSQTCNGLCQIPPGYRSRCEQKYVQKRLVALQGAGDGLYTDIFWFPSCCVCTITNS